MANISFIKTPDDLSLTGNAIQFRIAGRNAFPNTFTSAVNKIYITAANTRVVEDSHAPAEIPYIYDGSIRTGLNEVNTINVGYLQLTWKGKKVFLYCYNHTYNPLYNYPAGGPGEQYMRSLVDHFKLNPTLNADYDISFNVNDQCIDFTARKPGPDYNMQIVTTEPLELTIGTPGDLEKLTDNYTIGIRPESDGEVIGTFERPVRHFQASDGSLPEDFDNAKAGVISFDASDLLGEDMRKHFTFPVTKYYGKNHSIVKPFKLFAYERFGNPPFEQGGAYSDTFYCLQGKVGNFTQGELNYLNKTMADKMRESGMFLTLAPLEKVIDIYSPERLYFLFFLAGTYKTVVKQYYSDGTDTTDVKDSYFVNNYQVRELFISYDKIRTNAPKKVVKYEVYITDNANNKIAETRTFIMDYKYYAFARYFLYRNRLCAYEVVRTTGIVSKKEDIQKTFTRVNLPENFNHLDREEKQTDESLNVPYSASSGFFRDKYWRSYFQEFLLSRDVYQLKRGAAYPISVQETKNVVEKDNDPNLSREFEFYHSIHDDFTEEFTAQEPIIIGDFNLDFNTDFFTGATGELYEIVVDENFDNWVEGVPSGWEAYGNGSIVNENGKAKITSNSDMVLSFNTSYLTKVLYKLTFTVDSISPFTAIYMLVSGWNSTFIKAAGEYSFTFTFNKLSTLSNLFQLHILALSGAQNVNVVLSHVKLEYEYTELEDTLFEDSFDLWEPEGAMPLPLGWTAYGVMNATNFIVNDAGRLRLTTTSETPDVYSLQKNFRIYAGSSYRVTLNFEELTNFYVQLWLGLNQIHDIYLTGEQSFTFTAERDFYSFDLKFNGMNANRTALLSYFKIEKI